MTAAKVWHPELDDQQERVLSVLLAMQRQSWEQGVASHALLDLGQHELAEVIARDAVTRQTEAGKLAEIEDNGIVNSGAVGEVVKWAADRNGDPELEAAERRQLDWLLHAAPRAADGTLFHIEGLKEMWVDTVYMVVPFLVLEGETDAAARQFAGHRRRLFDERAGLYGWRWDEEAGLAIHPEHWGTGNGWVVAGIARTLRLLPSGAFGAELAEHGRTIIDACLAFRTADGVFHNVIDDESTFSDGNLAQMLAYGILTGVDDGWLPPSYEQVGRSLVSSARQLVDQLGFVQGVCGAPRFDRRGTSAEAQAFFLLATNAEHRLNAPA
jgi:unsaturated rhamnogalacturonyl hydrolase